MQIERFVSIFIALLMNQNFKSYVVIVIKKNVGLKVRDSFKDGNLYQNVETLGNFISPQYAKYEMFGEYFLKNIQISKDFIQFV